MNINLRKAALIAAGVVSAASVVAEEATSPVMTALSSTQISGYVSTSAFFDVSGTDGAVRLPGRTFDGANKVDQFNLDVVKLSIEKPLTDGDWSAGYKTDLLFGPDANTLGTSSVLGWNSPSDFTVKQAYVALNIPVGNGLTAKMGVFDAIIGYEVFEAGNNPNYSRSYAYFIEPFQHTGLLLSYQVNEVLALNAGIANAWDSRINAPGMEPGTTKDFGIQTYMGSFSLTAPESMGFLQGATLYAGVVHGLSADLNDGDPRTSLYGGLTVPTPMENLALGLAYDYRFTERQRAPGNNASEYATTAAAYVSYQLSKQLKLNLRGEYAKGSAGTWGAKPVESPLGAEEFFGTTVSLDVGAWENVLARIEFRWDVDLSDGPGAFGSAADPQEDAFILGLNVIYKF